MSRLILVLSPTKTLDESPAPASLKKRTDPRFLCGNDSSARPLVSAMQGLSRAKLRTLLGVSDSLTSLNFGRYKNFDEQTEKQAAWLYDGPAFRALGASDFSSAQVQRLQASVRILSGLYGILRPCDLVRPYRLDMGKRLSVGSCKDLYGYWRPRIAPSLVDELKGSKGGVVVSCASDEYWKAVDTDVLDKAGIRVVQCRFREASGRSISVYSKRARGMMCRFAIESKAQTVDDLCAFRGYTDMETYTFSAKQSGPDELVFIRSAVKKKGIKRKAKS